jgi:hypothetical protein
MSGRGSNGDFITCILCSYPPPESQGVDLAQRATKLKADKAMLAPFRLRIVFYKLGIFFSVNVIIMLFSATTLAFDYIFLDLLIESNRLKLHLFQTPLLSILFV